jgi:hypothetical protein
MSEIADFVSLTVKNLIFNGCAPLALVSRKCSSDEQHEIESDGAY